MAVPNNLLKRIFFGAVLTVFFGFFLVFEGWLSCRGYFAGASLARPLAGLGVGLLVLILAVTGCVELAGLAGAKDRGVFLPATVAPVVLLLSQPFVHEALGGGAAGGGAAWGGALGGGALAGGLTEPMVVLLGCLFLAGIIHVLRFGTRGAIGQLGFHSLALLYMGLGCWLVLAIRLLGRPSQTAMGQAGYLLLFLGCVKSCDIGAYIIGSVWGRHRLVPSVSPKKTWEGFLGGIVVGTVVAVVVAWASGIISVREALVFGPVVAISGQLGDLFESVLKRDAGSKDSAALIPEFGGVLDLLDSIIGAAPFGYMILAGAAGSS